MTVVRGPVAEGHLLATVTGTTMGQPRGKATEVEVVGAEEEALWW